MSKYHSEEERRIARNARRMKHYRAQRDKFTIQRLIEKTINGDNKCCRQLTVFNKDTIHVIFLDACTEIHGEIRMDLFPESLTPLIDETYQKMDIFDKITFSHPATMKPVDALLAEKRQSWNKTDGCNITYKFDILGKIPVFMFVAKLGKHKEIESDVIVHGTLDLNKLIGYAVKTDYMTNDEWVENEEYTVTKILSDKRVLLTKTKEGKHNIIIKPKEPLVLRLTPDIGEGDNYENIGRV